MSSSSAKVANGVANHEKLTKNDNLTVNGHRNGAKPSKNFVPPKGYLPFSHNVITPEMAEYARKNLNETEETREKALREMIEILKSDPDLVFSEDSFLLNCYLRCRKLDAKRAAESFKLGCSYIETYRESLERKDPHLVRRVIETRMVVILPYRDARGRAILYVRADRWDPNEIPADDLIFGSMIAVQSAAHNPVTQVNGFMVVLNLQDFSLQQLIKFSRYLIVGAKMFQRSLPVFMKAFHIINIPPFYKLAWNLVKPLLSEKIKNRFIFHKSSDLSSLHEQIPKEILPIELGGPCEFTNDHWSWDLDNIEKEFYNQLKKTYFKSKRKNVVY